MPPEPEIPESQRMMQDMRAAQSYDMLARYPECQPEKLALHYAGLAQTAAMLLKVVRMKQYGLDSPEADQCIARLVDNIKQQHRADLGIELFWLPKPL